MTSRNPGKSETNGHQGEITLMDGAISCKKVCGSTIGSQSTRLQYVKTIVPQTSAQDLNRFMSKCGCRQTRLETVILGQSGPDLME